MKLFKSTIAFLVVIALMLMFVACGAPEASQSPAGSEAPSGDASTAPAESAAAGEGPQIASASEAKVAFIMSGPISDKSWNYTGYVGLQLMEQAGAEITYQENTDPANIVESVRTYASEGYNIIFINDDSNQEDVVKTIEDFPNTQVFICNGVNHTSNVYPVYFADEDQGFVMGAIAGLLTKTNKIGFVGGLEFTPIIHCYEGFVQGVKYVNPDAEVTVTYTGSMTDVAAAKETAKAMFDAGCDVVAPNADAASLGVIEAGEEAGKLTVACGAGMESVGKTTCAGGVVMDTSVGYKACFDQLIDGTLPKANEEAQKFGIKDGLVLEPEYNAGCSAVTDEMKTKVMEAFNALKSGEVTLELS